MSGFDPVFDPAGSGVRDGTVPHPGAIDGRVNFLRADGTWAATGGLAPGPEPPVPGPDLDQWACNIAGYLTYEVSRLAVKYAVDWLPTSWIGDVAGGIVAGIAGVLLPETLLLDGVIESAIFTWVSTYVSGHLTDIGAALLDDVAWAKIHCALYSKIKLTPTDLHAAILAFTAILGGLVGWTMPAIAAITYLFEHLGITDVGNIPINAFIRNYDCSTCAITGIGPVKPVMQTSFDLSITDGTTSTHFIDTVSFDHATVSGAGQTATVVPEIGVLHNTTPEGVEPNIALVDSSTLAWTVTDDPGDAQVTVSADVPTTTVSTKGVNKPDLLTLGVDGSGVYSVVTGNMPTFNVKQVGAFAVTNESGVTISGLVVGNTYAIQSRGGPWYFIMPAVSPVYDWQISVDGGTTWDTVYWDNGGHRAIAGPLVVVPAWAQSGRITSPHHARITFVATATSIKLRVYDTPGDYGDNSGSLWWELLDVVYEPAAVQVQHNGSAVATRPVINLVDSGDVTLSVADNDLDDRVDVSLATAAHGTVTGLAVTAPITSSGGSAPTVGITTPLAPQYGGTGLDTSAVGDGDLLVGTSSHTWVRGGMGGGDGISVTELAGIFTIASRLAAGTNITLNVSGGVVTINAPSGGVGGSGLTKIATVSGAGATLDFSSISGAYTSLRIVAMLRTNSGNGADSLQVRFNSDSGAHYDSQSEFLSGASVGGNSVLTAQTQAQPLTNGVSGGTNTYYHSIVTIDIPFYAGTANPKTLFAESLRNDAAGTAVLVTSRGSSQWRTANAAITAISLIPSAGSWDAGSQAVLYGIA